MSDHVPLRVGSHERTFVAQSLLAHHRTGRLERSELDARLALAASARTEEDLRLVTIDLPDVAVAHRGMAPSPPPVAPLLTPPPAPRPAASQALSITFDVMVLVLTVCAFVCTGLLFAVTGNMGRTDRATLGLAAFGALTVGAGVVHLVHRLKSLGQRG